MTQVIYTDRSRIQTAQRCRRLRYLEYHAGAEGRGLQPARRSSHLVIGGAVHAGMEVLLAEGQKWLDANPALIDAAPGAAGRAEVASLQDQLEFMFVGSAGQADGKTVARQIEDAAVAAALAEFARDYSVGVEMDPEEARQRAQAVGYPQVDMSDLVALGPGTTGQAGQTGMQEASIVVDFADFGMTVQAGPATARQSSTPAPAWQPFDQDAYLREELAALVEGMVRCWARRRWRGVHEAFTVLEVEQEGEWKLGDVAGPHDWGDALTGNVCRNCGCLAESTAAAYDCSAAAELHFLSRHDALLLERSTGYLYLQSYKTTGSWDRRKELDAQVDMQGLSEAVDVERRFREAWELIHAPAQATAAEYLAVEDRINQLASPRVQEWLAGLPDPPTVLGVRYDYLLKGSRKEDKKAGPGEPRWNQESILCRAYAQEGITSADRRWAWTYDWKDESGKGRRLDYRSWRKQPVWRAMSMAEWIDLLDQGKVQEGALGENGEELDALGAQLVPVLTVYRNADEMLDLLEQLEAQEVQIVKDVEEVRRAEKEGGYSAKRSALNRLFPQTRTACSYPGVCMMRSSPTQPGFCFGPPDPEHDSTVMANFRARVPNHPKEGLVQIDGVE